MLQEFQLNVTMYKNVKEESRNEKKMGRKSTYLDNKEGHRVSMVELIIVQLLLKPVNIGHTKTSQGIFGIGHGE